MQKVNLELAERLFQEEKELNLLASVSFLLPNFYFSEDRTRSAPQKQVHART